MGTQKNGEYGADQIQILEGLEAVGKDPECTLVVHQQKDFIIWYMKL